MRDRRQQIINRLAAILSPLVPAGHFFQNRGDLPQGMRPAITVLDMDETAQLEGRQRGPSPNIMHMTPQIVVSLDSNAPQNPNVGMRLNTLRLQILGLVLSDSELLSICGQNGRIDYRGCETDLALGRDFLGQMSIVITFVYPFSPKELQ